MQAQAVENVENVPVTVRLVDTDGHTEVLDRSEVIRRVKETDLDLVCINDQITPPVFKIMDVGKYNFEESKKQKKKERKDRENAHPPKEYYFNLNISDHDFNVKLDHIREHLKKYDVRIGVKNNYTNRSSMVRGGSFGSLANHPDFILKRVLESLEVEEMPRMVVSDGSIHANIKKRGG